MAKMGLKVNNMLCKQGCLVLSESQKFWVGKSSLNQL